MARLRAKTRLVKYVKYCLASLLILVLAITLHYANEIRIARAQTPVLLAQAQQSYAKAAPSAKLTPEQLAILLAVEDPKFYSHHGVDLATPGAGMTTITQGLVKLLYYPEGFKQGLAKIRQTLIAQYALDALVSKDTQLDLFLNLAYFGQQDNDVVTGFAQAAQVYLHKNLEFLSEDEFISLVAMLIAPNKLKPDTPANNVRVKRIKAYLSNSYQPKSVLDFEYNETLSGTYSEEALMALLRLITDADPH